MTATVATTTIGKDLVVVSSTDFNQKVMLESSNWRSWHLRTNPTISGRDELIHHTHTFALRGKQYIECSKTDDRCRVVKWLGGVGRSLVAGWCLVDAEKNVVDACTTFAKNVGGANLFGQSSGGFTYYRELLTDDPIANDWVESLSDKLAELEGYGWGNDYDARIISPLRSARETLMTTEAAQ